MTIKHHPGDEALAALACGTLDAGLSVVVASHVSLCPHCRRRMNAFAEAGGALLERMNPAAMQADAVDRALAQLDASPPADRVRPAVAREDRNLPAPLAPFAKGHWRWLGRGVQWRTIEVPSEAGTRVFMLKAEPGIRLPHHKHTGAEWTCVFEGAFIHDGGRFGPGDFDEADESVEHKPVVADEGVCICLVAMQGGIELQGWLGRLLQPLVRF